MNDISRIGYNIGTLLSIDNILRFAKKIEEKEKEIQKEEKEEELKSDLAAMSDKDAEGKIDEDALV